MDTVHAGGAGKQSKEFLAGAKGLSVSLLAFADSGGTPTGTAYVLDIN